MFVIDGLVWTWSAELEEGVIEAGSGRSQRDLWPAIGQRLRSAHGRTEESRCRPARSSRPITTIAATATRPRSDYILTSRRGTEFVDLQRRPAHRAQLGPRHVPRGHDAGQRAAVCPAASVPVLHRREAQRHERPGRRHARTSWQPRPTASASSQGPAWPEIQNPKSQIPNAEDWPTFRHDAQRTRLGHRRTVPDDALA